MADESRNGALLQRLKTEIHPAYVLCVFVAGLVLASLVYGIIRHWELKSRRARFENHAAMYVETLQRVLKRQENTVDMVASVFRMSHVEPEEFRELLRPALENHQDLRFFEWIAPRLKGQPDDLPMGEEGVETGPSSVDHWEGTIATRYTHPAAKAQSVEAGGQLNRDYRAALKKIWQKSLIHDKGRLGPVYYGSGPREYSLIVPVFGGQNNTALSDRQTRLHGWVRLACNVNDTVESALKRGMPLGLDLYFIDLDPTSSPRPLYARTQSGERWSPYWVEKDTFKQKFVVSVGGRQWLIHVQPSQEFFSGELSWQPILMSGLVAIFGLFTTIFLWVVARKGQEASQLARERGEVIDRLRDTQNRLRRTLKELRRVERQLADQERQKVLSCVARGIAHDINNALSPVHGYADLLLENEEKLKDIDTLKRYMQRIKKSVESASETVRQMGKLYHSGNGGGQVPVDLNTLVEKASDLTQYPWGRKAIDTGKDIQVITQLNDVPDVFGREAELFEMLTNIIHNSVQAIGTQGTIWLRTRSTNHTVVVEVEDDGAGMSDNALIHCSEPFFTTRDPSATGLGLTVSEGLVAQHGGNISIESQPGEGTTVCCEIPALDPEEASLSIKEGKSAPNNLRILVVENERLERTLLNDLLQIMGHTVTTTSSGRAGLKEVNRAPYDVVFVAEDLDDMAAETFMDQICCVKCEPDVVILANPANQGQKNTQWENMADGVVRKPVQLERLRRVILKNARKE